MTQNDNDLDFDLDGDDTGIETEQVNDGDIEGTGETDTQAEQVTVVTDEGHEGPVTEPTNAQPEGRVLTDEEKQAEADKKKADAKAKAEAEEKERQEALTAFQAHVEGLFGHADYDAATGVLPEVLSQSVVDEYAKLPGAKGKLVGRQYLESSMQENMIKGAAEGPEFFMRARTYMELNNRVTKDKATKSEAAATRKVDPTEAHVNKIAAMLLAPNLVPVGADVDADWSSKAEALVAELADDTVKYRDWLALKVEEGAEKPDAPKVSDVVIAAAKIAQGRAATARKASATSTPRASTAGSGHVGNIETHLREAMNTVEVGEFMTIAQIVNVETSQYGGSAPKPSPGAVAARLFPGGDAEKCNIDFVRPEGKDEGHAVKGAVRVS